MKNSHILIHAVLLCATIFVGIFSFGCKKNEAPAEKKIRLALVSDYPPYVYFHQGKLTGIDVELGKMIAKEAGRELQIVNGTFYSLINLVGEGKADMAICALAVTNPRRKIVAFSDPYEFAGQTFLVRSGENIRYLTDMREKPS